jgi:hypothetical protein
MAYFLAFRDYDPTQVERDLRAIRDLGCNWVSLDLALAQDNATDTEIYLPYARPEQRHPTLPFRHRPELWHHFPSDEEIEHFVRAAHGVGLSVLFKPHVHPIQTGMRVRVADGSWTDPMLPVAVYPSDKDRWFASYTRILRHYARLLPVDAVCVGDELSGVYRHGEQWRRLVAAVRAERNVPITCAFNWWVVLHHDNRALVALLRLLRLEDNLLGWMLKSRGRVTDFDKGARRRIAVAVVSEYPDWCDILDVVGVNFYFPLSNAASPTLESLRAAWRSYPISLPVGSVDFNIVESLRDWASSLQKPLLFTEGGWGRWNFAARFPADWFAASYGRNDALQARCYEAFFEEAASVAVGMFFWDWAETGFSPEGAPAEEVVRRYFAR